MGRSLVVFSTLVGGCGLGLAAAYVMLVVVAFLPGGEAVAAFMVGSEQGPGYGYALIVVPYVLLLLHLWLRVNVAAKLLEMGDVERARDFATRRLKVSVLRGRREALANRTVLMRIACRAGQYEEVDELAAGARLPRRGMFGSVDGEAEFHRWRLEALLRREDLVSARKVVADAWPMAGRGPAIADFCACAAELSVRNNEPDEVRTWRDRALFAADRSERLDVTTLLAALRFGESVDEDVLERVNPHTVGFLEDLPGAALEVALARAELAGDEPGAVHEQFADSADARSMFVWQNSELRPAGDLSEPR